jgi:acetolactate synthase-1/3 small subunit
MEGTRILVAYVENRPGVLARVSGLLRRRNFNIESISVGHSEKEGVSRMTLAVTGDEKVLEQVMKQLNKLIEVLKVSELDRKKGVVREMALVKVSTKNMNARAEILQYVNIFRGRIIDAGRESLVIEITGDTDKIEAFLSLVEVYGIKELAKTGITAMGRGPKAIEVGKGE